MLFRSDYKVPRHTHTHAESTATEPTASEPRLSGPACLLVARAWLAGRFAIGGGRWAGTSARARLLRDQMRGRQPTPGWAGCWTATRGQERRGSSGSGVSLHLPATSWPASQEACGAARPPSRATGRRCRGGPAARGQPGSWAGLRGERCSQLRPQGENERGRATGALSTSGSSPSCPRPLRATSPRSMVVRGGASGGPRRLPCPDFCSCPRRRGSEGP